ncbi:Rpn9 protein [Candida orthopsilosis Co 90-125]|uniref:Rpn9 protein n=1 Tax=Candida orthopsilosis (strain 90-125) TaxID=1136231 RepID=H8WXP1_CANO9|nr:Rpn9 protein [Candida orthopsilosis Co 90-125]CCG21714.1 Rpn9 protein [Candida orthopsilosis Co 90-125]
MSAMDIDSNDVSTVLATIRSELDNSELISLFYQLEDYYERKLWHQLTQQLDEFYYKFDQDQISAELKHKIYTQFIQQFAMKLNLIKVVDFLIASGFNDETTLDKLTSLKQEYIKYLKRENNFKDNEDGSEDPEFTTLLFNDESLIYIDLQISRYYLYLKQFEQSESTMAKIESKFDNLNNDLSAKINAAYYLTKSLEYKLHDNYNAYYTNGLLFLSSVPSLTSEEKVKLCYDLCIAALLGDKVYNFGELILHDILQEIAAEDSPYNWLYNLIHALNAGDLSQFNHWLSIAFTKSPQLRSHQVFIKQKIIIMALLELISTKSTTNKRITFKEISEFTGTPLNDVEHLIIKCFSLKLIQGYINQIDEILVITWLQPRILNLKQVYNLYTHLVDWDHKVEQLGNLVYQSGGTVWAGI